MAFAGEIMKAYLSKWKIRDAPESHLTDYWFSSNINNAGHCPTEEQAQLDCDLFHTLGITIPSSQGGLHTIRDFKVEKRAKGEFVISCDAPFIPVEPGTSEAPKKSK